MRREQLEEYHRRGRLVRSSIYLRKSRAEEHMSLEDTLARHKAGPAGLCPAVWVPDPAGGHLRGSRLRREPVCPAADAPAFGGRQCGKYEAVLCMDMQRLGRGGMYDQGFILDTFKSTETLIVTPDRLYDLTKELDEEAAEMQTFLSRSEYRMITKRLRRGTLQSVQNGAYMANAPFGYRKIRINKIPSLEIVPEEAECVRQIFQLYASGKRLHPH